MRAIFMLWCQMCGAMLKLGSECFMVTLSVMRNNNDSDSYLVAHISLLALLLHFILMHGRKQTILKSDSVVFNYYLQHIPPLPKKSITVPCVRFEK